MTSVKSGTTTSYVYKADGLRLSKGTTTHIWDGANVALDIVGASVVKYIRGINLIYMDASSVKSFYSFNAHGDVVGLTNSSGSVTKSYRYDAFGNEDAPVSGDANPFRYCGEYFDKENGRIYLRARYYNAQIGRFTSQDTHWNPGNMIYGDAEIKDGARRMVDKTAIMQSVNLYTYCIGNPIMYIDSNGEIFFLVTAAIVAVAGAIVGGVTAAVTGNNVWAGIGIGAAVGGVIGLTGGAAAAYILTGTVTASTAMVSAGAVVAAAKIGVVTGTITKAVYDSWQKCEAGVRSAYNAVKQTFNTPFGNRIVDGFNKATQIAHEAKYGYQSLSKPIKVEIAKDLWLLQNGYVKEVVWHFYQSAVSGTGGGSGPLIDALKEAGFKIIYH